MLNCNKSPGGQFAEFPPAEYSRRVELARRKMAEHRLDGLLLTGKEQLRYFAGGPLTELFVDPYNIFFLILPADPAVEPALVMSSGREGPAQTSWIEDRRFWGYGDSGSILNQSQSLSLASKVIEEKGLARAVLGTELDNGLRMGMPVAEFQALQALLPGVSFRSAAPVVWAGRSIKSVLEIDRLRRACRITCQAFKKAMEAMRVGITERELAAIVRSEMFRLGASGEGFLAIYGGEQRGIWADALASDYRLRPGDMVMFDGGCCVDGYYADVSRMAWMGEPPAQDRRWYELAKQANLEVLAMLRPGVTMQAAHAAGQRAFRANGAGDLLVFGSGQLGHGIGLAVHEPPDISAHSEQALEAGMVIAVEPAISNTPKWAESQRFFIVENNVVITESGCELLTPLSNDLWVSPL